MYQYAVPGALLAELILRDRITVDRHSKGKLVGVVSRRLVGEPLLDECLAAIATAKRPATAEAWVLKFVAIKQLKDCIAERLCRRGVLREEEGKTLRIFTRREYPQLNPEAEKRLIRRLGHAILGNSGNLDTRTVVLVSLALHSGLLITVFGLKETRSCKTRIDEITNGDAAGDAVEEAIEAKQSAIFVATVISAIASI